MIKIPVDRVGVLVGKNGKVKEEIGAKCGVELSVDSKSYEVLVRGKGDVSRMEPFKAVNIVTAIARGFSPQRAFRLLSDDTTLELVDIREYSGKSDSALRRIKGRLIGLEGKSRRLIEELTDASISVYGHTVAIIGTVEEVELASNAVRTLAEGSTHRAVYNMLQKSRTKAKLDRMKLWEESKPID